MFFDQLLKIFQFSRWLRERCPPLPQPQHTRVCLPTAAVDNLAGRSTVVRGAWFRPVAHEPSSWL